MKILLIGMLVAYSGLMIHHARSGGKRSAGTTDFVVGGRSMGGVVIARQGEGVPDYDEAPVARHLKGREVHIEVDVGVGRGRARVWTCDLTHGYISINADYRS